MDNVTMSIEKGIHSHLGGLFWGQRDNQGTGKAKAEGWAGPPGQISPRISCHSHWDSAML